MEPTSPPPESGTELLDEARPGWFLLASPRWIDQPSREEHLCSYVFGSYGEFLTGVLEHDRSETVSKVDYVREEKWQEPSVWGLELSDAHQQFWERKLRERNMRFWRRAEQDPASVPGKAISLLIRIHGDQRRDSEGRLVAEAAVGELNRIGVPGWLAELFEGQVGEPRALV